jgi:hypothetical protein
MMVQQFSRETVCLNLFGVDGHKSNCVTPVHAHVETKTTVNVHLTFMQGQVRGSGIRTSRRRVVNIHPRRREDLAPDC